MTEQHVPSNPGARRIVGRLLGTGIVVGAVVAVTVALLQWQTRPQTDDATVRANFVGIAPQVTGHIVELHVRDSQQVQAGELLFLIDPRPYEIALERARATLALTRTEVDGLKNSAASAMAGVSKAEAQLNASAAEVSQRKMDPVVADAEIVRNISDGAFARVGAEVFTLVVRAPGTSSPTSARHSCVTSLRERRLTSICSRNPTSTSGALSLGSVGRCCRRTAPA
jgi:multidrug efflux pump subunit AcrA (membrane-fusion protein)